MNIFEMSVDDVWRKRVHSIIYKEGFEEGYAKGYVKGKKDAAPKWTPVSEGKPKSGKHVFVTCEFGSGEYVCDAFWADKFSVECSMESDIDPDYDEETDAFYFPEGWWEIVKNWGDYSYIAIYDRVTAWMPKPKPYDGEEEK